MQTWPGDFRGISSLADARHLKLAVVLAGEEISEPPFIITTMELSKKKSIKIVYYQPTDEVNHYSLGFESR